MQENRNPELNSFKLKTFHIIDQIEVLGGTCESGMSLLKWRVTWNYSKFIIITFIILI